MTYASERGDYPSEILDGGTGNDTILMQYYASTFNVHGGDGYDTLNINFGSDSLYSGDEGQYFYTGMTFAVTFDGIEHFIVNAGDVNIQFPDVDASWEIYATSGSVTVGAGNDYIVGPEYVDAGGGNDYVEASVQAFGDAGNDTLVGAHEMNGGPGDDLFIISTSDSILEEAVNEGTDTVESSVTFALGDNFENLTLTGSSAINGTGNGLDNFIIGNDADNSLKGLDGADILKGGLGDDRLAGGPGTDTMYGGAGNDTYFVDNSGDQVIELSRHGKDLVNSSVSFTLGSYVEISR